MPTQRANLIRVTCPHCGSQAATRTSQNLTRLHREIIYQCSDPHCGHSFKAVLEITQTICPSRTPNPDVHLPLSPAVAARDRRAAGNDNLPTPANDPLKVSAPRTG